MFCVCCRNELDEEKAREGEGTEIAQTTDESSPIFPPKAVEKKEESSKASPQFSPVTPADGPRSSSKESAPDPVKQSAAFQKKGDEAFNRKSWEEASKFYTQAIEKNPQNAAAFAGRAGVRVRQGDSAGAMPDLDQALTLEPQSLYALRDRAEARAKLGDIDGSLVDYNAKLTLAPGDGRALCGRGECKLKKGDKEGAISDFNLAVRLTYPGAQELLKAAKAAKAA